MKTNIDLASWNRREHFEFFSSMQEPYHGVVVNMDCTGVYQHCKSQGQPFFLTYLYKTLQAANDIQAMRLRIEGGAVVDYAQVHCNVTVARPDRTFGFCSIDFDPDFARFVTPAQAAMQRVQASQGLGLADVVVRDNDIHFSTLPDIRFTGLTHARRFGSTGAEPKISVGQVFQNQDRWWMPFAVSVHHGLVDGQHVSDFLKRVEALFQKG